MLTFNYHDLSDFIVWTAGILGALITIYKFSQLIYKKCVVPVRDFFLAVDRSINIISKMDYEFTTNGGKSIKDAINRIEAKQISNEQKLRAILSYSPAVIFESDRDGKCIWVNRSYEKMVGKSLEELRGYGWVNCIIESDRDRVIEEWESSVHQHREFISKYNMIGDDGQIYPVSCHSFIIYDKNNAPNSFIGYLEIIKDDIKNN